VTGCEACGRKEVEVVGVAAVPGHPVSISWCRECLEHNVQPLFCVEATVCPLGAEGFDDHGGLPEAMKWLKERDLGNPTEHFAEWFLTSETVYEGEYVRIDDLLERLWAEA